MHEYPITAAALWLARSTDNAAHLLTADEASEERYTFRRLVELTFAAPCCYMSSPAAVA